MPEEFSPHSTISAYFALTGDLAPDLITQAVGIEPTKTFRKGEQNPHFKVKHLYSYSCWRVYSEIGEEQDIEAHVDDLLKKLERSWPSLVTLSKQHRASLVCIIHAFNGDRPYIGLGSHAIQKLSELNASFDVDLYTQ